MSEERYLTFALGKGRLAKKTLELLKKSELPVRNERQGFQKAGLRK